MSGTRQALGMVMEYLEDNHDRKYRPAISPKIARHDASDGNSARAHTRRRTGKGTTTR
jgi:hypothetical protein